MSFQDVVSSFPAEVLIQMNLEVVPFLKTFSPENTVNGKRVFLDVCEFCEMVYNITSPYDAMRFTQVLSNIAALRKLFINAYLKHSIMPSQCQ